MTTLPSSSNRRAAGPARSVLALAATLRSLPSLLWAASPGRAVVLASLQLLQAAVPLGQLWVARLIVNALVAASGRHGSAVSGLVLRLIAIELGLAFIGLCVREIVSAQRQILAERLAGYATMRLLTHAQALDFTVRERPEFHHRLQRAQESAFYRPAGLLLQLLTLQNAVVTLAGALILLGRIQPWAPLLLIAAALPYALVQSGTALQQYSLSTGQTLGARRVRYLARVLAGDESAAEVQTYGLGEYLLARCRVILRRHEEEIANLAGGRARKGIAAGLLPVLAYTALLAYVALQAGAGRLTLGDLALYFGIVLRSQDALQQAAAGLAAIVEHSLFLDDFQAFLRLTPSPPPAAPAELPAAGPIRFENVSFRYPGADRAVLEDVSLTLAPGEIVAIVGDNGAGKTTLVKLLTRLYEPNAGSVTVGGVDLARIDAGEWRQRVAVIFQDFQRYHFTAAENIGFGRVDVLHDRAQIVAAAEEAGIGETIARLPQGYDTVLGRQFGPGIDLSGGEWQRLALARAFMRDAPILVLDEPTAALDPRAEYELFLRIRALAAGRTVLLISHRFSTVRMADRIYVLEGGRIVETGSHEDLLHQAGRYAELFSLQAGGYR